MYLNMCKVLVSPFVLSDIDESHDLYVSKVILSPPKKLRRAGHRKMLAVVNSAKQTGIMKSFPPLVHEYASAVPKDSM